MASAFARPMLEDDSRAGNLPQVAAGRPPSSTASRARAGAGARAEATRAVARAGMPDWRFGSLNRSSTAPPSAARSWSQWPAASRRC
eukprot:1872290-Pyramimonas_sp.AAC.1